MCGEHLAHLYMMCRIQGSPPHLRGAHYQKRQKYTDFTSGNQPKNFSSNTLHLSSNLADYPTGRAATNRNRTPSHGQHHTCKPS